MFSCEPQTFEVSLIYRVCELMHCMSVPYHTVLWCMQSFYFFGVFRFRCDSLYKMSGTVSTVNCEARKGQITYLAKRSLSWDGCSSILHNFKCVLTSYFRYQLDRWRKRDANADAEWRMRNQRNRVQRHLCSAVTFELKTSTTITTTRCPSIESETNGYKSLI